MRLWHVDLIHVLPREQLVAQWRELSAIAGKIKIKEEGRIEGKKGIWELISQK